MIQLLTQKDKLVYNYIKQNPNCIQTDVVQFLVTGEKQTRLSVYKLQSLGYVKAKVGKQNKKHLSIDKRRKL
jgi:hypothetical protein